MCDPCDMTTASQILLFFVSVSLLGVDRSLGGQCVTLRAVCNLTRFR